MIFSVIIPTYHRNDLLAKCLDCLSPNVQILDADQYEVIVSDDGHDSNAKEMIKQNYPWVKWVAGPRKGPAANRNNGVRYAQGEWLVFTDDDCLPDPQWLISFFESLKPDTWVYEGKTICNTLITSPLQHAPINMTGGYLWSCNMMVQRSLFFDLKGFDENFSYPHLEDVDFRDRIQKQCYTFLFVDKAIVNHPARRLPYGKQLGKVRECEMYYLLKNNKNISIIRMIIAIIRGRLVTVSKFHIQVDSFISLASLAEEILHLCKYWTSWKVIYSKRLEIT
jgi:GT2 family glycosyltransferase